MNLFLVFSVVLFAGVVFSLSIFSLVTLDSNTPIDQTEIDRISVNENLVFKSGHDNSTGKKIEPYVYKCGGTSANKNNCTMILSEIKEVNRKLDVLLDNHHIGGLK